MPTPSEEPRPGRLGPVGNPLPQNAVDGGAARGDGASSASEAPTIGSQAGDLPTRVSGSGFGSGLHDPAAVAAEAQISGYSLHDEIHRGGQGIVYRATQLGTKRRVALKVLLEGPFAGETARRRFEREVELAASLRHPSIVAILDSGISLGRYYFAMEYIEGLRLDRYLAQVRPPLRETMGLLARVCAAVNFAHQRGVIHRDLKPSNILVDAEGEPHVLDFGLAKQARRVEGDETTVAMLSVTGQVLGTLAYMSPEQAAGSQDVDVRSDVYSLGVIFYEALLGHPPYSVTGPMGEVLTRIAHDDPIRPRSRRSDSRFGQEVDDELETILLKALEKDPARRYQSAGNLERDLRCYLAGEPIEAKRASGLYMFKKTLMRYRWQAGAAGLVLVMLVGFLIAFAVLYRSESYARAAAETARTRANEGARAAALAEESERAARERAEVSRRAAERAAKSLRRALVRQKIQRGDLARARGDLADARDNYWDAFDDEDATAARWALRRYYLATGESSARLLYFARHGPAVLSPDGSLTAVCESPQAIAIRKTDDCQTINWVQTPAETLALSVDDSGGLVAAGAGWLWLWPAGGNRPQVIIDLPDDLRPTAAFALRAGTGLVLIGESASDLALVQRFSSNGELLDSQALNGFLAGTPDFLPGLDRIAIPTAAGVEVVSTAEEGGLQVNLLMRRRSWTHGAVTFADGDVLAVLGDAVDATVIGGPQQGEWHRLITTPERWDYFDMRRAAGTSIFGARDGRVAVVRGGRFEENWRITLGELESAHLSPNGANMVTLDDQGVLTHWVTRTRQHQRRRILDRPATAWAAAPSGSAVLLADVSGRVFIHAPNRQPEPARIMVPDLAEQLSSPQAIQELSLGICGDGTRAVVRCKGWVQLLELERPAAPLARWSHPRLGTLKDVAISGDGRVLAFWAQSMQGDEQAICFASAATRAGASGEARVRDVFDACRTPVGFVGSVIRGMAFVPHAGRLLVARSNGQLVLLDSADSQTTAPLNPLANPVPAPEPWVVLDSPATALAFDRAGTRLAAACDDGLVRLVSTADGTVTGRVDVGRAVHSLAFSPSGEVLMVRIGDGTLKLYETAKLELIVDWAPADWGASGAAYEEGARRRAERPDASAAARAQAVRALEQRHPPIATWIGDDDAMLLGYDGRVYEHQFRLIDELIGDNRPYARQREVAARLAEGNFAAAWAEASRLRTDQTELGRCAQEAVVELALRHSGSDVPETWQRDVLAGAGPPTFLRLGHAAYDGERFDLAQTWLWRAHQLADGDVDAHTLWRMAECDYMAGDFSRAASLLRDLPDRLDFDATAIPWVELELTATLLMDERIGEAREIVPEIGHHERSLKHPNLTGMTFARVIGQYLTGAGGESLVASTFEGLLMTSFAEETLTYRDDVHFFSGELARRGGDLDRARAQYQRCVDTARDVWPANWSRYRLRQMAQNAL
ncbi:MAG: protein kinase [Planctomycetes bacterium]|nr:protein kinase [Planctomycetota bacterium]